MNKNSIDLLCYLESQLVFKSGMINETNITAADRKQIDLWDDIGFVEVEQIPRPDRHNGPVMFTHRIRFSDKAWQIAHKARKKKAQQHTPTLKEADDNDGPLHSVRNGQAKTGESGEEEAPDEISYKAFCNWLEENEAELTLPQQASARMFFEIMNMEDIRFFWENRGSGKSFLLRAMDQYITQAQYSDD